MHDLCKNEYKSILINHPKNLKTESDTSSKYLIKHLNQALAYTKIFKSIHLKDHKAITLQLDSLD